MQKYWICATLVALVGALLSSCSSTRFVGEGEYLLDKVVIRSDTARGVGPRPSAAALKPYLQQQPNIKVFGWLKWPLYVYNWSKKGSERWLDRQLRTIGEAPVILDTTLVEESVAEMERYLVNKGYTDAQVTALLDTSRRKKATVIYQVECNEPYVIRNYTTTLYDSAMDSIAHLQPPARTWLQSAFRSSPDEYLPAIGSGNLFDRDRLDRERQRITTLLRRRGYYAFNRDYLMYYADSAFNRHVVDLDMRLLPYRRTLPDGTTLETPHRQYYIKDVTVLTDYEPLRLESNAAFVPTDTTTVGSLSVIYGRNGRTLRPRLLNEKNYLRPGALFNERNLEQTYFAFMSLEALRNVNIRFTETEENDTMKLSALILTSPSKTHGFGFEIDGTTSAGDFGVAPSVSYQHRNLFRGSEVLSVKIRGAYESLSGGNSAFGLDDYWEAGGEAALTFPRFLFPLVNERFRRSIHASTEFKLSYNRQTRPEYKRAVLSGRWSYFWQNRADALGRHEVRLADIDYLFLPRISKDFMDALPQATLQYNYVDQFIVSTSYTYTFNNYNPQYRRRNTRSLRASFELAGNTLYALSNLFRFPTGNNGHYELFGIEYSQYAKADFDFSRGIILDNRNKIALHVGAGLAVPYGNADRIPFERRYFAGGANSVRGWAVRELGPGSMTITDSTTFISQAGDIRFDANIEYRSRLFWKFELAAFADAGNIWTIRRYNTQPRGNFNLTRFYKEIAVAYGLGLRLDFDYFLFRFDAGLKAYDPQQSGAKRWAIARLNFTDNFAWHFAIGYPF